MAEITRPKSCENCSKCYGSDEKRLCELPEGDWKLGETVDIELALMNPAKVSALSYGIPLLGLVLFVAVASWLGLSDVWQAIFAFIGLAVSFVILRLVDQRARRKGRFQTVCSRCEKEVVHNG